MDLPFSQACENNKAPILSQLTRLLEHSQWVLEVGSGTGQHAVHFAPALPHLIWQTADLPHNHAGIQAWLTTQPSANLLAPIVFDLNAPDWPKPMDAVFTANTLHIMPWVLGQRLMSEAGAKLPPSGLLIAYGPFKFDGQFTSQSNQDFDGWLKEIAPHQGIRDFEEVDRCAQAAGLTLIDNITMPANNQLLAWRKRT